MKKHSSIRTAIFIIGGILLWVFAFRSSNLLNQYLTPVIAPEPIQNDMILDGVIAPGMCFKIFGFQGEFTKMSNATTNNDVKLIDDIGSDQAAFVLPLDYQRQVIMERGYAFKWVPGTQIIEVYRKGNTPMRIPGSYCGQELTEYVTDKYIHITDVAMESIPTRMPDGFKINLRSVTNDDRGIKLNIMYGYKQDFQAISVYVNEKRSFDLDHGQYRIVIFQKPGGDKDYHYWLQIWKKK